MHRHCGLDLEGVFEDAFSDQRGYVDKAGSKEGRKQGRVGSHIGFKAPGILHDTMLRKIISKSSTDDFGLEHVRLKCRLVSSSPL